MSVALKIALFANVIAVAIHLCQTGAAWILWANLVGSVLFGIELREAFDD